MNICEMHYIVTPFPVYATVLYLHWHHHGNIFIYFFNSSLEPKKQVRFVSKKKIKKEKYLVIPFKLYMQLHCVEIVTSICSSS